MTKAKKFSFISLILIAVICFAAFTSTFVKVTFAEEETQASFVMESGAEIRGGNAAGIRWKATVNKTYYESLNIGEGTQVTFGAFVTANSLLKDGESVGKDSAKVIEITCPATAADFDEESDEFSFYASIVYDNMDDWSDADKEAAYATELVARAFIKVGEDYHYAENNSDVRSMRAIALAAVLDGKSEDGLSQYYGGNINKIETTGYYGINDEVSEFDLPSGAENSDVCAYIGAQPVAVEKTADGKKINVSKASNLKEQEKYNLSIFVGTAAYVQPFVAASNVIRTAEDLAIFELKDIIKVQGTSIKSNTSFDGYYVVANDIDAKDYTHQAVKDATANSTLNSTVDSEGNPQFDNNKRDVGDNSYYYKGAVSSIEDMPIYGGLTGTFDGAGHTISDLTVRDQGLFGLMTNGTVKNIAFNNVTLEGSGYKKNVCLFAQNVLAGTFENVYVKANPVYGGEWHNHKDAASDARGNRALVAIQVGGYYDSIVGNKNGWKTTNFTNCVFEYEIKNTTAPYCFSYGLYAMESGYNGGEDAEISPNFNNVYVISNTTLSVYNLSLVVKNNTKVIMAENEAGEELIDAVAGILNGWNDKDIEGVKSVLGANLFKIVEGVKRYANGEAMNAAGNDYASFSSDYWSVSDDGVLSWKK